MSTTPFLFVACQLGIENVLVEELARARPELRRAYSRPGFVTFKYLGDAKTQALESFELKSVFARTWGWAEGKFPLSEIRTQVEAKREAFKPDRIHVFAKDEYFPGDEPPGFEPLLEIAELFKGIKINHDSKINERVLDVIRVAEDEWWMGWHVHHEGRVGSAGGKPVLTLPSEAPSRAFLKCQEAFLWTGLKPVAGEKALEIGCTPGGTLYFLLSQGLDVVGVDPHLPDPSLAKKFGKHFRFIKSPVEGILKKNFVNELGFRPDYFFWDVSLSLKSTMPWILSLLPAIEAKHAFVTLKMTELTQARDIPEVLEAIRSVGYFNVKARQLGYQRQEFLVYATR